MVVTNLVLEIVRLFVDKKADFAKQNESDSVRTSLSRPFVAKILRQYLTFNFGHDSFGPLVKNELVILKDYHTLLESIELAIGKNKGEVLARGDVPKDIFAVHVDKNEEMDVLTLRANQHVEQKEFKCLIKLKNDYRLAIVKI